MATTDAPTGYVSVAGLHRLLSTELALLAIDHCLTEDETMGVARARMVVLDLLRRLEADVREELLEK